MVAAVVEQTAGAVFYSQFVGLIFDQNDPIAANPHLVDHMKSLPPEAIDNSEGKTSFNVESANLAYFMHMLFANMPADFVLNSAFDGIHVFEGQDEAGNPAKFNAQLVTLSQVPAPQPV